MNQNDVQRYNCWKLEPFEHTVQQVTKHSLFPTKWNWWNGMENKTIAICVQNNKPYFNFSRWLFFFFVFSYSASATASSLISCGLTFGVYLIAQHYYFACKVSRFYGRRRLFAVVVVAKTLLTSVFFLHFYTLSSSSSSSMQLMHHHNVVSSVIKIHESTHDSGTI